MADRTTGQKQPVTLTWEDDEDQIVTFDATISEKHQSNSEVTDHPIETGASIVDHIRRMPEELSLTGVVTDDPLVVDRTVNATPASTGGDSDQRAVSSYNFLLQSKDQGRLIRVFTKLRDYRNMVIVSLSVTRDARESRIVRAELTLREVMIANTEQVEAPTPAATAAPKRRRKRNQGKKTKKEASDAQKRKSRTGAARIADATGAQGFFNQLGLPAP